MLTVCHSQPLDLFRFTQDCKLPAGRGSDSFPSPLLPAWSSLLSLERTLSHHSWPMGRDFAMLLFGPEMQAACSRAWDAGSVFSGLLCLLLSQKVQPSCCLLAAFPPPMSTSASRRQSAWWNTTQPISATTPASLLTRGSKWVLSRGCISAAPLHRPGRGFW